MLELDKERQLKESVGIAGYTATAKLTSGHQQVDSDDEMLPFFLLELYLCYILEMGYSFDKCLRIIIFKNGPTKILCG